MSDAAKSPANYCAIQGIDPTNGKACEFYIRKTRLDSVAKMGNVQVKTLAHLVPWAIKHYSSAWEGLREDDGNTNRCYVSLPPHRYVGNDGHQVPRAPDRVFLVFTDEQRVIYNWRWEECDPADPMMPMGFNGRFDKRLL